MPAARSVEHILAFEDPGHACNQGSILRLHGGRLMLGFNMERSRHHADSGQSCYVLSNDDGRTWARSSMRVVWPWTEHGGNWDCAFSQVASGEIIVHTRVCSFLAPTALKGRSDQARGAPPPDATARRDAHHHRHSEGDRPIQQMWVTRFRLASPG